MATINVVNHITLDGVMQAPMGPDEDRSGGFAHGGWAMPFQDEVMGREMGAGIGETGTLLLGRRTYEHMAATWPQAPDDNPFKRVMMEFRKLVASRTLSGPLEWQNAELLPGDPVDALADIDGHVTALGSGELVQSLLARGLSTRSSSPSTRSCWARASGCSPTAARRPPSAWTTSRRRRPAS